MLSVIVVDEVGYLPWYTKDKDVFEQHNQTWLCKGLQRCKWCLRNNLIKAIVGYVLIIVCIERGDVNDCPCQKGCVTTQLVSSPRQPTPT